MTRPRMVTFWVTLAVPNLCNTAVAEDESLPEARVFHCVDTQIQSNVIRAEGLSQSLVLELNLGFGHRGVSTIIVGEVDNPVANSLGCSELPVVVVSRDDIYIVTGCKATGWWREGGDKFWLRDRTGDDGWMMVFVWSP